MPEQNIKNHNTTLEPINRQISDRNRQTINFIREYALSEEGEILCYGHRHLPQTPHPITHTPDMLALAVAAADLYLRHGDNDDLLFAANLVNRTLDHYRSPAGSFHQQYAAAWTTPNVFRTAPWANCFFGHHILDCLAILEEHLDPETSQKWTNALRQLGEWVYGNPIVATVVFNCAADLCSLLWRIGKLLNEQQWIKWAENTLYKRFDQHISPEGLNIGEGGGCSGQYQLYATQLLSHHVYHLPEDERSYQILKQMHTANCRMATPDGRMPGNYGTRSSGFKKHLFIPLLVLAARGDRHARDLADMLWQRTINLPVASAPAKSIHNMGLASEQLKTCVHHAINGPIEPKARILWEQALKVDPEPPEPLPAIITMPSIDYTIVRRGQWQAWATQYEKGNWTRGFSALWNAELGDFLFATHHSLPGERGMERRRFDLGEMNDWAAFPHVIVETENGTFHSQRVIDNIQIEEDDESLNLTINEKLQSDGHKTFGQMISEYTFAAETLTITSRLDGVGGTIKFDYHIYKHPLTYLAYWTGSNVRSIQRGKFPEYGGGWEPEMYASPKDIDNICAIQIDNTLICFQIIDYPENTDVRLEDPTIEGLHCDNTGGARIRLVTNSPNPVITMDIKCLKKAMRPQMP